jgi:glycosyltransferase involved in cell wall biosynthesis
MRHIFVNALAASAGGGITYVRNLLQQLECKSDLEATVLLSRDLRKKLSCAENISFIERQVPHVAWRFWREQQEIPSLIRAAGADVLLSAGNFAVWNSPVPQILLSRNALYTSKDFLRDLQRRGDYRLWMDNQFKAMVARKSIQRAECTVAPTEAFAATLREWSGRNVVAIHHGFDQGLFVNGAKPLSPDLEAKLALASCSLRLLFVSHYNYYRNFETLIRALRMVKQQIAPRTVKLILTCNLKANGKAHAYATESAASLVAALGLEADIIELGTVPYHLLHHVYRYCDIYVTPAYAESFGHPLVEAMASGLPVVASDLPVHREICGNAAAYFPRFSPSALAGQVRRIVECPESGRSMKEQGMMRAREFSWSDHVDQLLRVARDLTGQSVPVERGLQ